MRPAELPEPEPHFFAHDHLKAIPADNLSGSLTQSSLVGGRRWWLVTFTVAAGAPLLFAFWIQYEVQQEYALGRSRRNRIYFELQVVVVLREKLKTRPSETVRVSVLASKDPSLARHRSTVT